MATWEPTAGDYPRRVPQPRGLAGNQAQGSILPGCLIFLALYVGSVMLLVLVAWGVVELVLAFLWLVLQIA